MIITTLCGSLPTATTTRRWSHLVQCTADAITPPISSHVAAIERPARPQQSGTPVSQLAPLQLQEPQVAGWYPQQGDRLLHLQPPQLQQQHMQQYAPQAEAVAAPFSQHSASYAVGPGPLDSLPPAAGSPAVAAPQKAKHRKRHKNSKRSKASQQVSSLADQQQLQQYVQPTKDQVPVKFAPCGKRDGYKVAAAVTRQLSKGQKVLMPAGTGMQLVRSTAMLSTARSMVLGHNSSTGLVFQPSLSTKAAAAAGGTGLQHQQQQQQQQQQQHWQQPASADDRTMSSNGASTSAPNSSNTRPTTSSSSASKGVMLLVAALPELQLRRFDQQPLVVARSTRAVALSSAIFARMCKQGYTTVRAAGPEATRLAMLAAARARGKLTGCGLDLAVVPATEYVDVETLAAFDGVSQYVEAKYNEVAAAAAAAAAESAEGQDWYGPGEELPKQFVQVTVLHLVRCVAGEPWKLLPWPVPTEQLPAVQHAQQQQQQQQVPAAVPQLQDAMQQQQQPQQQQQQQPLRVVPGAAVVAASGAREQQQQQQQQQAADDQLQDLQLYGLLSGGLAAHRGSSNGRSSSSNSSGGNGRSSSSNSNGSSYGQYTEDVTVLGCDSLQGVVQPASVAAAQRLQAAVGPSQAVGAGPFESNASAAAAAVALSTTSQGYVPPPLLLAQAHLDAAATAAAAAAATSSVGVWRKVAPAVDPSAALLLSADGLLSPEQLQGLQQQQQQQLLQQDEADKGPHIVGSPSLTSSSSSSNIVSRQPGGLLLQQKHSKKGSRQLVAAAQAGSSNTPTPSCSSS